MRYLVVDANLSGTGIRDKYNGGYVSPLELNLSSNVINQIDLWLSRYENEHFDGFLNSDLINKLDTEGRDIAKKIKDELGDIKIEYFSAAKMTKEII